MAHVAEQLHRIGPKSLEEGDLKFLNHHKLKEFHQKATKAIWETIKDPTAWLKTSSNFLDLHETLDFDVKKEPPFSLETAEGIRKFLREEVELPSILVEFESLLLQLWYAAAEYRVGTDERPHKRTQSAMTVELLRGEMKNLRAESERLKAEKKLLVQGFVMVDEEEVQAEETVVLDKKEVSEEILADEMVVVDKKEVAEEWEMLPEQA